MIRRTTLAVVVALICACIMLTGAVNAQGDPSFNYKSGRNNSPQEAKLVRLADLPLEIDAQTPKPIRRIKHHPRPFVVSEELLESIKAASHYEGQAIAHPDPGSAENDAKPMAPGFPCKSFVGITSTGWNPPDPHVAVGLDHVVAVVNSSIAVFSKESGELLYQVTAESFFAPVSPPSTFIFDPKVVYDPFADRFVVLFLCTDDVSQSSYLVAASKTSDAMGDWWLYDLDASMVGTTVEDNWPDYPGLGFDYSDAVYVTSNDWGFTSGFKYSKIRILKKEELYSGTLSGWHDFWDMRYHDNSVVFTIKPAVTLSDAGGEYLLSNIWYGANYTTYFKIEGAGTPSPTITRMPRVTLSASYSIPPNPSQANSSATLQPVGPMTQDVFYRNDKLYTSFAQSYNWGSGEVAAARLVGIDVNTSDAFLDDIYGSANLHYFFPTIATDYRDRIYILFSRSGAIEYPSVYFVADYETNDTSYPLRIGRGYFGSSGSVRWGDYGGISVDPSDRSVWLFHEWATTNHDWSTWIGNVPGSPDKPSLLLPADGSSGLDPTLTLDWTDQLYADSFYLEVATDPLFQSPIISKAVGESESEESVFVPGDSYFWRVRSMNHCGESDVSPIWTFEVCGTLHGDADKSSNIDIDDAVYLIVFIFSGGPAPDPYWTGDANCTDIVDIDDAVYLISYIFSGGPPPCGGC